MLRDFKSIAYDVGAHVKAFPLRCTPVFICSHARDDILLWGEGEQVGSPEHCGTIINCRTPMRTPSRRATNPGVNFSETSPLFSVLSQCSPASTYFWRAIDLRVAASHRGFHFDLSSTVLPVKSISRGKGTNMMMAPQSDSI